MAIDKSIIEAIGIAVEKEPASVPLRLYLASLWLRDGDYAAALTHFTHVLGLDPANLDALKGAAAAAASLGDKTRAEGYRKLILSLGGVPGLPEMRAPSQPESVGAPESAHAELPVAMPTQRSGEEDETDLIESEMPRVKLADVGGMEAVKRRLELSFLAPLRNPKLREAFGKSMRGGLLLYGPPGCGKTFIARATAGELGARFLSVGLTDVLDMWFGNSEHKLHAFFEQARRKKPSVLFFDELDALGHKRSQLSGGGGRNLVNTLLAELDGADANNESVFVLAATNCPWDVDSALRRPGRFDRMVLVLPPDEAARATILQHQLKNKTVDGLDIATLARQTAEFSGADLAYLCESATESAMEDSISTGHVRPLNQDDFKKALKELRPSTREWFNTAKNYAQFANESGMYDDLLKFIQIHRY